MLMAMAPSLNLLLGAQGLHSLVPTHQGYSHTLNNFASARTPVLKVAASQTDECCMCSAHALCYTPECAQVACLCMAWDRFCNACSISDVTLDYAQVAGPCMA